MRYSNSVIRQFLRRLKRPAELDSLPLAQALRQALGTESTFEAAQLALKRAFDGCGPGGERYHRIIWTYDVERAVSREDAANELGISPRHFFRLRSEAVQAFADFVARVLAGPTPTTDPIGAAAKALAEHDPHAAELLLRLSGHADAGERIEVLARLAETLNDVETIDLGSLNGRNRGRALLVLSQLADARGEHDRAQSLRDQAREHRLNAFGTTDRFLEFEISAAEFVAQRYTGRSDGLIERAEHLERLGKDLGGEHALNGLLYVADAATITGRPARAREAIDLAFFSARENRHYRVLGFALLRRAQLAMLEGNIAEAERLARAASVALHAYPDGALSARTTLNRVLTLRGEALEDGGDLAEHSWYTTGLRDLEVRNRYERGLIDAQTAYREASEIAAYALSKRYDTIAAHALATAAIAAQRVEGVAYNCELLRAWQLAVSTDNHLLARDLFEMQSRDERDFGPLVLDDASEEIVRRTLAAIPGMGSFAGETATEAMRPMWPLALAIAAGKHFGVIPAEYAQAVAHAMVHDGVTATSFERISNAALRSIATWTAAFLHSSERGAFDRRLHRTLRAFVYQVERAVSHERYRASSRLTAS